MREVAEILKVRNGPGQPAVARGGTAGLAGGAAFAALLIGVLATAGPVFDTQAAETESEPLELGFLAFGDSGLHDDYVERGAPITSREELIERYRRAWLKDHRDPAEFTPPPSHYLNDRVGFTLTSGAIPAANAMKRHCLAAPCEFALMLGDNIYPDGAAGDDSDERRFAAMLTEPFGALGAGNPDYRIYAALGNHDWHTSRAGAMAQVKYLESNPPFYMNGNIYRVKPPSGKGQVELFVIDTMVLLAGQTVARAALNPDGSEAQSGRVERRPSWSKPSTEMEKYMIQWLERQLEDSDARWKFVVGHHPIWSGGGFKFEQARVLRRLLLPALCRYADAYFAGHDHTLELHEDSCESGPGPESASPLPLVVSGAASAQRGVHSKFIAHQSAKYPASHTLFSRGMVWGFAYVRLKGDSATVDLFSTPNSGSGEPQREFRYTFARRSGALRPRGAP
ncbi:MAG: hypothetical protein F4109_12375 [Gammaproteobacteria bacterium]|nr:hypothetical protein [Gammaproteobacteria bacterium]MYD02615.1 hypothetical protein [Gammaproteobacteria bacterium]MYI26213.1 hypothetical protein [Gammaproteobacteria bacterium]